MNEGIFGFGVLVGVILTLIYFELEHLKAILNLKFELAELELKLAELELKYAKKNNFSYIFN